MVILAMSQIINYSQLPRHAERQHLRGAKPEKTGTERNEPYAIALKRCPHPEQPTDFREKLQIIAAPHPGQSIPAGGRQHAHPHFAEQYQNRSAPA